MKLKDCFCHYRKIVKLVIHLDNTAYGFYANHEERTITLYPDDDIEISIPCANKACTSEGFRLYPIIMHALNAKDGHAQRFIGCDGRESAKFGTLRCSRTLTYDAQATFS